MGTVYEAHDDRFETSVALKEVLIDLAKIADPNQQQMVARAFEREAKTLALLHHEAFPHVIDYFSERDHQYLIMELIRGEDLGEQLQRRRKPFEFDDVLNWTHQLLDALDYLHTQEQPIIHRDLKPQNMKLTARGKIKVLDFGIAKGADSKSSSTITNQTFVAATLNYSPIEQLLRVLDPTFREFISQRHKDKVEDILEHTADARSDLYSLGATLYQLLTATQPHDTLKRALDLWAGKPDPLPSPMELNPQIPPYFNNIMLKAMEIDRDSRFVSAAEMQKALKDYLDAENRSAQHAAWLADQRQHQQPAAAATPQAPPDLGMQTQLRIAEEQKFLAELDGGGGGAAGAAKTEVLPPMAGQLPQQQKPIAAAPPPAAAAKPPFILPADPAEERRRIAEQQKFLAELDSPPASAPKPPPPADPALTDYGQRLAPHVNLPAGDQTNYGAPVQPAGDQTQVSYLANVLPQAQQAKAADATVINPQLRHEAPAAPAPAPVSEERRQNKLLWLIPVAGIAALLLVSLGGFIAYKALSTDTPPTPAKTPFQPITEASPAAAETPASSPGTLSETETGVSTPAAGETPEAATGTSRPAATPQQSRATQQDSPRERQSERAGDNNPKPPPARDTGGQKPPPTPKQPAQGGGKKGKVDIDKIIGND